MNDKLNKELVEGIKQNNLASVLRALDAGADLECVDQYGFRGLALRTACFLGQKEIVLELLRRGANPEAANSDGPGAPLRMAVRGKRDEIIAILRAGTTESQTSGGKPPAAGNQPAKNSGGPDTTPQAPEREGASAAATEMPDVENLVITACYGVDTQVLEGDLFRLSQSDVGVSGEASDEKKGAADESKPVRRKFW
jgi:hypothetical protein